MALTADGLTANHLPMMARARAPPAYSMATWRGQTPLEDLGARGTRVSDLRRRKPYISPSWYPAKQEHGKVVPTWNYSVVHAHGTIRFNENPDHSLRHLGELTSPPGKSRSEPWRVSDAPAEYIEPMVKRVIALEIAVTRLIGKFKAFSTVRKRANSRRSGADLRRSFVGRPGRSGSRADLGRCDKVADVPLSTHAIE